MRQRLLVLVLFLLFFGAVAAQPVVSFNNETGFIEVTHNRTSDYNMYVGNQCTAAQFDSGTLINSLLATMYFARDQSAQRSFHFRNFPGAQGIQYRNVYIIASYTDTGARSTKELAFLTVVVPNGAMSSMDAEFPRNLSEQRLRSMSTCGAVPAALYELGVRVLVASGGKVFINPDEFNLRPEGATLVR